MPSLQPIPVRLPQSCARLALFRNLSKRQLFTICDDLCDEQVASGCAGRERSTGSEGMHQRKAWGASNRS